MLFALNISAQETSISGKVTDDLTNEPIPFATIIFKGTTIGVNTDMDGKYSVSSQTPTDSIICTLVGYKPVKMRVKKGQSQVINIVMNASKVELNEVIIKAGENPANIILKNIIANKDINDPAKLETYQYKFNNFNQTEYLKKGNLEEMIMYYEYYFKNKYVNTEGMFKVGSVTFILTYILWFVL